MKNLTIIIFFFSLTPTLAQQAWTQKKGEGYFQVGLSTLFYDQIFGDDTKKEIIPRPVSQLMFSLYGEYGLLNNLMATLILPFDMSSTGDLNSEWIGFAPKKGSLAAFGNISTGLTYKLYEQKGYVFSTKLNACFNTSTYDDSGLRTGFDATSFTPSILLGIGKNKYFASLETGVSLLTNKYSHRFVSSGQIGKPFFDNRLMLILNLALNIPISESDYTNLDVDRNAVFTALYQNQSQYFSYTLKGGYIPNKKWSFWFSLGGGTARLIGHNFVASFSIGYSLKRKKIEEL